MPYKDHAKKREWEAAHRHERSASFFGWREVERERARTPPIEVSEQLAAGGEEGGMAWAEYEASLGSGNPEQDAEVLRRIRRR